MVHYTVYTWKLDPFFLDLKEWIPLTPSLRKTRKRVLKLQNKHKT